MGINIPLYYKDNESEGNINYDSLYDILNLYGDKYIKTHREESKDGKVSDFVSAIVGNENQALANMINNQRSVTYYRFRDYIWDRGRIFVYDINDHVFEIFLTCENNLKIDNTNLNNLYKSDQYKKKNLEFFQMNYLCVAYDRIRDWYFRVMMKFSNDSYITCFRIDFDDYFKCYKVDLFEIERQFTVRNFFYFIFQIYLNND